MTRIGIVTASTRPRRIGHHVATWVSGLAPEDAQLVDVDLRELDLPLLDEPEMPPTGTTCTSTPFAGRPSSRG